MQKAPSQETIDRLSFLVKEANNIVVLTGAGISTESGIPDFRSPGGIWSKYRIIEYAEYMASEEARLEDWRRRFDMEDALGEITPNIGHDVLTDWVKVGKCSTINTQNIDGLHQVSGVPDTALIEIHGNARHAICTKCSKRHEIAECRKILETTGHSPTCTRCSGIVKSAVVMFGEAMPVEQTQAAFDEAARADLFIAIGTSLVVYPAAGLPAQAKENGAKLVIISAEPTAQDQLADLAIHASAGATLSAVWPI